MGRYIPSKHDLKKFNLGVTTAPRCPLCHDLMVKRWDPTRQLFIFTCSTEGSCKIAIRVDDPFVDRWDQALEKTGGKILCPNPRCPEAPDGKMRYFATMTGFMKGFCPACKATISNAEKDRDPEAPEIRTPEEPGALQ